jgi:dimethylaniline monooxygenase (N-oxide forming)
LITFMVHGRMSELGFKPLTHRVHPSTSATIVAEILYGRVAIKHGIDQIDGRTVHFTDGSHEEFDDMIAATGFETEFPFLDTAIVHPVDNRVDLYKRVMVPGWPGLYFVGMINLDTPINYACERQAGWVREVELGDLLVPGAAEMKADIAAKRRWVERHYGDQMRHAVQEESMIYYAELKRELRRARWRTRVARWRGRVGV